MTKEVESAEKFLVGKGGVGRGRAGGGVGGCEGAGEGCGVGAVQMCCTQ